MGCLVVLRKLGINRISPTWRIISGRTQVVRITPIYKPFKPFGRETTLLRRLMITMVIKHLLIGMLLQVGIFREYESFVAWIHSYETFCKGRGPGASDMDNHRFYALEISNIHTKIWRLWNSSMCFPFQIYTSFHIFLEFYRMWNFSQFANTTRFFHWPFVLETPKFPNRPQLWGLWTS